MESFSNMPKKKRFSEHKSAQASYKISYSLKKNDFSFYEKPNCLSKNKKLRLNTDYAEHDYSCFQNFDQNISKIKPSSTKKGCLNNRYTSSSSIKRKQASILHPSKTKVPKPVYQIPQSTKHNIEKSSQLKNLFNKNPYQSKIKNNKKTKQSNHNISVFLNLNKKNNPLTDVYQREMATFIRKRNTQSNDKHYNEKSKNRNDKSRDQNDKSRDYNNKSRDYNDLKHHNGKSSNYNDHKRYDDKKMYSSNKNYQRSQSKGLKDISKQPIKHLQINLLNKNNIRLKTTGIQQKARIRIEQKSGIGMQQKRGLGSKQLQGHHSTKHSKQQKQVYGQQYFTKKAHEPQQSTVKTIKKPQPHIQPSHSSQQSYVQQDYGLTQDEIETFGDRFPYGFEKIKLLGRGGFSLVWLGKHTKSGKQFAVKQIITNNTHQTHIKEIWFGTMFFTLGGVPKPEFAHSPGVKNLVRLYSYEINQTDTWIFYEKCGQSLGTVLYDIKSQKIYGDDKLYKIHYKPFYLAMQSKPSLLSCIIVQICKSLSMLSKCGVVHSDLKPQNILLNLSGSLDLCSLKLIDYGSSFQFCSLQQFSMATPQYMPPQILNYIIHQNQSPYEQQLYNQVMTNYKASWAVDIWSLGCVLLEIVVGVPLWMSLPLLVRNKIGKAYLQKEGLFAVKGRLFPEIIQKQRAVVKRLDTIIQTQNYSRINLSPNMKKVLKGMLEIDFNKRMSPDQIIQILQNQI